jgi:hypothetical protein
MPFVWLGIYYTGMLSRIKPIFTSVLFVILIKAFQKKAAVIRIVFRDVSIAIVAWQQLIHIPVLLPLPEEPLVKLESVPQAVRLSGSVLKGK